MKLELKHLAAYLPYGVKVEYPGTDDVKIKAVLTGVGFNEIETTYLRKRNGIRGDILSWVSNGNHNCDAIHIKLHLRPMSDLTKCIEIYNAITVPIDYISTSKANSQKIMRRVAHNLPLDNLEYWQVERLFELHFDVFCLIESGLAVKK